MQRSQSLEKKILVVVFCLSLLFLLAWVRVATFTGQREGTLLEGHFLEDSSLSRVKGFQFTYGDWCDEVLNSGGWVGEPFVSCEQATRGVATCGDGHIDNWQWSSDALRCGAHRLGAVELRTLLQGKWLYVAGDSIARFFVAAVLRLLSDKGEKGDYKDEQVVIGHQDFEYTLPENVRLSFVWAPYAANITTILSDWQGHQPVPEMLIVSFGLWHMLHVTTVKGFNAELHAFRRAADNFVSRHDVAQDSPAMSFFSISEIISTKLKTSEKREKLTVENVDAYNAAINSSSLLVPNGPFYLIDMHHLTQGCGSQCTQDGIHYSNATYDAALQIFANNMQVLFKDRTK